MVEAIADAIARLPPGELDPSLGGGQAGMALFSAWLATARGSYQARDLAERYLDHAIDAMATSAMGASLYGGFTGVAWAVNLVDRMLDPSGEDRSAEVDDATARLLSPSHAHRWPAAHDLVVGVTGLGVYALERYPRPAAMGCLRHIVQVLDETAKHDEHGIYWWSPPAGMLNAEAWGYRPGRADLGVAHGVPGAIALLGAIFAAGVEPARSRGLLEGAVDWLFEQAVATESGPTFPVWVAPGAEPSPARCAWCYGDPGVAAALLVAARGVGEPEWEREAVALACRAAERPTAETGVVDAGFCHGTAGLAHLYNRMYQATGEERLGQAARYWLERTLDFCRDAQRQGGKWVKGTENPRVGPWTGVDLVDGAAGIALVLLAAVTSLEPIWDRMFLLSAPHVPHLHRA
ncbi:MAG: lanthionine synthetase C family protein [Actinomycetota bacterium]|nr:lanthionine synthetase C family protein [Actinomycetota bacterium]